MISRVSAEFEAPELAEASLHRIKESISGIHRTGIIYNKRSEESMKLRNGTLYTIIPTAVTTFNYLTAVIESPASEDVVPELFRSRTTIAYVICESDNISDVKSVFNAMGGLNIHSGS
ncbi:MAG: hypothetical protein IKK47_08695 [Ruminococcus sp.]|nr:hypothetical protein [Ruminococcus sp.]